MKNSVTNILMLLLVAVVAIGCASTRQASQVDVVWPLPPDKPRIKFVRSISSSGDVEGKKSFGLVNKLLGGESLTGMTKPYGVHVDKDGRLFVADTGWHKVLVFDFAAKSFWILGVDGRGVLSQPVSVSSDDSGRIYVSDSSQARIVVYDHDGQYLNAFGGREHLVKPVGVSVDSDRNRVYVVDTKAHKVVVFDRDGNFVSSFGNHGPEDGSFNWPTNIAVGKDGNVYVVDMLNFRVQVFNPSGEFLWKFGGVGRGFGQFSKPKGVAVDSSGNVFVADAAFNNVQIFDGSGRLLLFFGEMGAGPGQFWMPAGMDMGPDDTIYIADQFNKRINVYQLIRYEGDSTPPPAETTPTHTGEPVAFDHQSNNQGGPGG